MCEINPCVNDRIYKDGKCFFHYMLGDHKPEKKKQQPIARESKKRAKENRLDQKQNKELRAKQPLCQMKTPVCTKWAQGIQHLAGRTGQRLTDKSKKISACNACNQWEVAHPKEAEAMKVKLSRNKIS